MDIVSKKIDFESSKSELHIYFFGDTHIGNVNFDRQSFKRFVKMIEEDPFAYVIGMGDFLDCININDKRFDAKHIDRSYKISDLSNLAIIQAEDFIDMVMPIKDKIITFVSGNHEDKFRRVYSIDVFKYICNKLDIFNPIYNIGIVVLHIKQPNHSLRTLTIFLNHGDGGNGKREGYPLNILHDVFRWSDCDVNIMGHIHQLIEDVKMFNGVNTRTDMFKQIRRLYGVSGTFLKTYAQGSTNYFEHKGRYDSVIGALRLDIRINRKYRDNSVLSNTMGMLTTLNKIIP